MAQKPTTTKTPKTLGKPAVDFTRLGSSLLAIAIGLLFGFFILLFANPHEAFNGFVTILKGGFAGGLQGIGNVFYYVVPIMMTGLGVAFAFRTGLFNIGGPGQFVLGGYVAILLSIKLDFLPGPLRWIVPLLGAMLAGALWAAIPGILTAYAHVNIVIGTIMMNYIGMYLANFLITRTVYNMLRNQTMDVPTAAWLPKLGLDKLFPNSNINVSILIAIAVAILIHIILNKTTFGYELKACGLNRDAGRYAGINEKRNIILSIMISGGVIGLGAGLLYLAGTGRHIYVVDVLAAEGFTGIPVALLAYSSPIGVIFSALFIAYITVAGFYMQVHGYVPEIIDIILAAIIYFSAFSLLIREWLERRKLKGAPTTEVQRTPVDQPGDISDTFTKTPEKEQQVEEQEQREGEAQRG